MSTNLKREHFIKAILTNEKLTEEQKSELISDMMDEFKNNYPELQNHATKQDVSETELRLTKEIKEVEVKLIKEIENTRKEIKEIDLKLTKEIKEVEAKLTKEIEKVRLEIKDLDVKLTKEIADVKTTTLKWTFIFWASQMLAIGSILYKVFS